MSRNLLQIVLKHADGLTAEADSDAVLLRRFVASRDDAAFALLVKRHGPMVWAVCRQSVPNHADAEDAFQATFLALAQSVKKIRFPERLAGWLHAAAVRICSKVKRSFSRRTKHERTTARTETDSPVSAAAWADLQAAVHAEVSALPPSLRAVFVLCDLEGVEPAAVAKQLGLKAGTLTGQLARARQRLIAALSKRGLSAGAVALGSAVAVPEALAHKLSGGVVPSATVIALASEVTTMGVNKLKILAAGLLLAGGLTLSGFGLLAKADGQTPTKPGALPGFGSGGGGPATPIAPPPGGLGMTGAGGDGAGSEGSSGGAGMPGMGGGPVSAPAPGEFLFVGKPNTIAEIAKVLKDKSAKGWEYTGPLDVERTEPPTDLPKGKEFENIGKGTRVVLVFKRRPALSGMGGGFMTGGGMGSSGGGMPGGGFLSPGEGGPSPYGSDATGSAPAPLGITPGGMAPQPGIPDPLAGGYGQGGGVSKPEVKGSWKTIDLFSSDAEVVAKAISAVYLRPGSTELVMAKGRDQLLVYATSEKLHTAIADAVRELDKHITKPGKSGTPSK